MRPELYFIVLPLAVVFSVRFGWWWTERGSGAQPGDKSGNKLLLDEDGYPSGSRGRLAKPLGSGDRPREFESRPVRGGASRQLATAPVLKTGESSGLESLILSPSAASAHRASAPRGVSSEASGGARSVNVQVEVVS